MILELVEYSDPQVRKRDFLFQHQKKPLQSLKQCRLLIPLKDLLKVGFQAFTLKKPNHWKLGKKTIVLSAEATTGVYMYLPTKTGI